MARQMVAQTGFNIMNLKNGGTLGINLVSTLSQISVYDPNTNIYTPDWSKSGSNLVVTPIIYHNATKLNPTDAGVVVTWKRQEGAGSEGNLTAGETVVKGVLTVNQNKLTNAAGNMITYICYVSYTLPNTTITLNHQQKITYTLIKHAVELHYVTIEGESVMLYDSKGNLTSPASGQITLTATTTNVNISTWQYKRSDGSFVAYPTTSDNDTVTGASLIIKPNHSVFFNDVAVIRIVTSDPDVSDTFSITKLYDGEYSIIATLSNEQIALPSSAEGSVTSYLGADTTMHIYEGNSDASASWTVTATPSSGVKGTLSGKTYTVTGLTTDAGYVDLTATKAGYANIVKRFTLTRQKQGETARIYAIDSSVLVLNRNISKVYSPTSVAFSAFYRDGNSALKTDYSGRFIISESIDGTTFSNKYTSTADEASKSYTPSANNLKAIRCTLYAAGGTTTALDAQTVMITDDGRTGQAGTSVIIGNEAFLVACNSSGNALGASSIVIPFSGYIGSTRAACTCTPGTLPSGVTAGTNTAATTSTAGSLTINIASGATFGNSATLSGQFDLSFTCNGITIVKKISWAKSKASVNGTNAIIFQITAPEGFIIENSGNNVKLQTLLTNGTTIVTSGATYQWQKLSGSSYVNISGQTGAALTVTPSMVDGMAAFACVCTYSGKSYTAYWSVYDKVDNITASVYNSIGEVVENGQSEGVGYVRLFQSGVEIDEIKSSTFSESAPTSPATGALYYHIDKTNKIVTLKKWTGSAWADQTGMAASNYDYEIYRLRNGIAIDADNTPWVAGKVFWLSKDAYGDPGVTTNFNVEVYSR